MLEIMTMDTAIKDGIEFSKNIEVSFGRIPLEADNMTVKLIKLIEQGDYSGGESFVDRYKNKLPVEFLSNGCKCALCAYYIKDKWISLEEAGLNALSVIFSYIDTGKFIVMRVDEELTDYGEYNKFTYDGKPYNNILEFNAR